MHPQVLRKDHLFDIEKPYQRLDVGVYGSVLKLSKHLVLKLPFRCLDHISSSCLTYYVKALILQNLPATSLSFLIQSFVYFFLWFSGISYLSPELAPQTPILVAYRETQLDKSLLRQGFDRPWLHYPITFSPLSSCNEDELVGLDRVGAQPARTPGGKNHAQGW